MQVNESGRHGDEPGGDLDTRRRDRINKTGFPFQLAVEREIKALSDSERWRRVVREVPYSNGFIDLVAQRGSTLAVLECKRPHGQDWIFLVQDDASDNVSRCRLDYSEIVEPDKNDPPVELLCNEFYMPVGSYESDLCVFKGSTGNQTIEGISRELLMAGREVAQIPGRELWAEREFLVPIVVTTANLFVCRYNPARLDVESGEIAGALLWRRLLHSFPQNTHSARYADSG